jgi:hypothetical protein
MTTGFQRVPQRRESAVSRTRVDFVLQVDRRAVDRGDGKCDQVNTHNAELGHLVDTKRVPSFLNGRNDLITLMPGVARSDRTQSRDNNFQRQRRSLQ